jgi:4-carboxymuconolactone decarboxylase
MMRPPLLEETNLSPEQKRVFDIIRSGPRGIVEGPLRVWLQSPGLADPAQQLGAFCRYGTSLEPRLSELAIITVGAYWQSGFEWHVHAPIAARAGVSDDVIVAIKSGAMPPIEKADERTVHQFTRELLVTRHVSDQTYQAAVALLGVRGCVELVGILGYYTLISMTINAFQVPVPEGSQEPFPSRL